MSIYQNDKMRLLAGKVTEGPQMSQKDGKEFCIITLTERDNTKTKIFFRNNSEKTSKAAQLADRASKAIKKDAFITVLVLQDDGKDTATGLDFKYSGLWKLKQKDKKGKEQEVCVIVGPACSPHSVKDDIFAVSMPVSVWNKDTKENNTVWFNVSFLNTEKSKTADTAKKIFTKDKQMCAIRCGSETIKEVNGKTYHNLWGYRIEAVPKKD